MSSYTKLFTSILESTVWGESAATKVVWITLLAMKDRNGEVQSSVPGLARRAGVTREECEAALALFLAPDPDSHTQTSEGRRIEAIPGGWFLINHEYYQRLMSEDDSRERATLRVRKHRERQMQLQTAASSVTPPVTSNASNPM